jgi:hypothetical protein
MEDKVFNLLEKMYLEFTDFKQDVSEELISIKNGQVKAENQITRIELDHGKKLEALFDGYKQNTKLLEDIKEEVSNMKN